MMPIGQYISRDQEQCSALPCPALHIWSNTDLDLPHNWRISLRILTFNQRLETGPDLQLRYVTGEQPWGDRLRFVAGI